MTYRCHKLREAAKGRACVLCGKNDGTVIGAHYTGVRRGAYGGGLGIKVHDFLIAHLCADCHRELDTLSRSKDDRWEHSEQFHHLIALTLARLFNDGTIRVK
jgi:hypothetical protein